MKPTLAVLALGMGIIVAMTSPLIAAQTNPYLGSPSGHTIFVPPPKHPNYQCSLGTCTCSNSKDCSTMGADHVCVPGTFKNGSCTQAVSPK
jgi:hypothetical protein